MRKHQELQMYSYLPLTNRSSSLVKRPSLKLKAIPSDAFFKDGKLWSYVNVDDELGFAVMDFEF